MKFIIYMKQIVMLFDLDWYVWYLILDPSQQSYFMYQPSNKLHQSFLLIWTIKKEQRWVILIFVSYPFQHRYHWMITTDSMGLYILTDHLDIIVLVISLDDN